MSARGPAVDSDSATPLGTREPLRKPHLNRITPSLDAAGGPRGTKPGTGSSTITTGAAALVAALSSSSSTDHHDHPPRQLLQRQPQQQQQQQPPPRPADQKENPRQPSFDAVHHHSRPLPPAAAAAAAGGGGGGGGGVRAGNVVPPMMMMMVATGTDPSSFAYAPDGSIPGYHPPHHPPPMMMMRAPPPPPPPPLCPPLMRYMSSSGYSFNSTDAVALLPFPHLAYAQSFGVHGVFGPPSHYNQQQQHHDHQHTMTTTINGTSTDNRDHQQHRQLLQGGDLISQPPPHPSTFAQSATTAASSASSSTSYATPTALYYQQQQQQHQRPGSSNSNTTTGSSDLDIAVRALLDLTPSVEESVVEPSSTGAPTITNANNNHDSPQGELDSEKESAVAATAAIFSQQPTLALAQHHHEQQHGRPVASTAKPFAVAQKNIIKPPPANGGVATIKNKNWLEDDESALAEHNKRRKIGPHMNIYDPLARTDFTITVPPGPATNFQAQDNSKPTSSLFEEIAAMLQHPPSAHAMNERNATATKKENDNDDHPPDFPDDLAYILQSNEYLARNALQLIEESVETDVACKCKNTKCLKLYCSCFQNGKLCQAALCKCNGCFNTAEHSIAGGSRTKAIFDTLKRRPDAFDKRLRKKTGEGCFCKKTRCLRKYCDCFANNKYCGPQCGCTDCFNTLPQDRLPLRSLAAAYGVGSPHLPDLRKPPPVRHQEESGNIEEVIHP